MDMLPWHFKTLQTFGLYYQDPKRSWPLKLLHTVFMATLTIHFAIFLLTTLLMTSDQGVEAFTAGLFLSFTYIAASFKLITFLLNRVIIDDLLDKFRLNVCRAKNEAETRIIEKYQCTAKRTFVVRTVVALGCSFFFLAAALISVNSDNWELPFNAYQIFNISSRVAYVLAYGAQLITVICSCCIDVTLDSTAWAFIILICCQLELLSHRIKSHDYLVNYISTRRCVEHHNLIFCMVHEVQSCFITIIVPAFLSALITVCSSIYQLAQKNNTVFGYLSLMSYIACLIIQLYYFCWFSNELQLKNETVTSAVFGSEWLIMTPFERKEYWFVMLMGTREMVISWHGLCSLNNQTFIWMLQATYAAFNLLKQVSVSK